MTDFPPGTRVRVKPEHDPLYAFAVQHGLPLPPCGTVNADQPYPGTILVTFDEDGVEAAGACAPMVAEELEVVEG